MARGTGQAPARLDSIDQNLAKHRLNMLFAGSAGSTEGYMRACVLGIVVIDALTPAGHCGRIPAAQIGHV